MTLSRELLNMRQSTEKSGDTTVSTLVSDEYRDDRATAAPDAERGRLGISTQLPGYRCRASAQPESSLKSAAIGRETLGEPAHFFPAKGLQTKLPQLLGRRQNFKTWDEAMPIFLHVRRLDGVLTGDADVVVNEAELRDDYGTRC